MGGLLSDAASGLGTTSIITATGPVLAPLAALALAFGLGPRIAVSVIRKVRQVAK